MAQLKTGPIDVFKTTPFHIPLSSNFNLWNHKRRKIHSQLSFLHTKFAFFFSISTYTPVNFKVPKSSKAKILNWDKTQAFMLALFNKKKCLSLLWSTVQRHILSMGFISGGPHVQASQFCIEKCLCSLNKVAIIIVIIIILTSFQQKGNLFSQAHKNVLPDGQNQAGKIVLTAG